jgi:hypothetical protein
MKAKGNKSHGRAFARAITVLVALLAGAGTAEAATYQSPVAGARVTQSEAAVLFDWTWESGEYAASIYFCPTAAPDDPCWSAPARQTAEYRTSSARVDFRSFPTGIWYWRLCVKSIYSEDDVCYVQGIRKITVITAGEGNEPDSAAPMIAPPLSKVKAQRSSRRALKERFGSRFTQRRSFAQRCRRRSATRFICHVEWSLRSGQAYSGRVTVRSTVDGVTTRVTVLARGTAHAPAALARKRSFR